MTEIQMMLDRLHGLFVQALKRLGIGAGAAESSDRPGALRTADSIRARSLPQNANSTELIRQERDRR